MTLLTNFSEEKLPVYREAIKRYGAKGLRIGLTVGKNRDPSGFVTTGLHVSRLKKGMYLDDFWFVFRRVEAEFEAAPVRMVTHAARREDRQNKEGISGGRC